MSTLTQHTPAVNTGDSSEAQERELAARWRQRPAMPLAYAGLSGVSLFEQMSSSGLMRLRHKRRSLQRAALAMMITPLLADGRLPQGFRVIW